MPLYELQELAARRDFIQVHPPETLLARLKQLGWPPSPTYYPTLVQTMAQPGGDTPAMIASTITALHGPEYWTRRIALWEELKIFSTRTPYVRNAIEEYLEGDYVSAIYVAVPQVEGLINDYGASAGGSVTGGFRNTVIEFKRLIESRKALLFPRFAPTHVWTSSIVEVSGTTPARFRTPIKRSIDTGLRMEFSQALRPRNSPLSSCCFLIALHSFSSKTY